MSDYQLTNKLSLRLYVITKPGKIERTVKLKDKRDSSTVITSTIRAMVTKLIASRWMKVAQTKNANGLTADYRLKKSLASPILDQLLGKQSIADGEKIQKYEHACVLQKTQNKVTSATERSDPDGHFYFISRHCNSESRNVLNSTQTNCLMVQLSRFHPISYKRRVFWLNLKYPVEYFRHLAHFLFDNARTPVAAKQ